MTPTEALARPPTICKCGLAKQYHFDPHPARDHDYEPRYEPIAWSEGYAAGRKTGIEQAAEAADREADYQRFLYPKGGPLTQWAAQTLAPHNPSAAVAPWYCPECGHDVDHTTPCPDGCPMCPSAAVAPLDVEALREQVYYLLFIYGQMDAEHGHWAAVRRMLNIDAAYADAIRKRGGA